MVAEIEKMWENEPNVVSNEVNGYHVLVHRSHMGNLNGYVGVTREHPWFGLHYISGKISGIWVHGGLTFSSKGFNDVFKRKFWYFGFDTGHHNDVVPSILKMMQETELKTGISFGSPFGMGETYKDINYVITETNSLYEQIKLVKDKNPNFKMSHKQEYRRLHKVKMNSFY